MTYFHSFFIIGKNFHLNIFIALPFMFTIFDSVKFSNPKWQEAFILVLHLCNVYTVHTYCCMFYTLLSYH